MSQLDRAEKRRKWSQQLKKIEKLEGSGEDTNDAIWDIKDKILDDMMEWLPEIRAAGRERPSDLKKTCSCLELCYDTIRDLCIEEGRGMPSVTLYDRRGKAIFSAFNLDYCACICWVLMEVLVAAALTDEKKLTGVIRDTLRANWFEQDELERVLRDGSDDWTDEMYYERHEAARQLLSFLLAPEKSAAMKKFAEKPTATAYMALIRYTAPDAKEDALDVARKYFLAANSASGISWDDAVRIFSRDGRPDDIVRLLEVMPPSSTQTDTDGPRLNAVQILLDKASHRGKAIPYIKKELQATKAVIWDRLNAIYPSLDEACAALVIELDAGNLPRYRGNQIIQERAEALNTFATLAMKHPSSVSTPVGETKPGAVASQARVVGDRLRRWYRLLDRLPNREAAAIRVEIFESVINHPLFKSTGDFWEILATHHNEGKDLLTVAGELFAPPPPVQAAPAQVAPAQVAGQKRPRPSQEPKNEGGGENKKLKREGD